MNELSQCVASVSPPQSWFYTVNNSSRTHSMSNRPIC